MKGLTGHRRHENDPGMPGRPEKTKAGRTAVIVMVKYPRAGAVKTRLGSEIGTEKACELYREFVRILLETCWATGFDTVISSHPGHPVFDYQDWLGHGFQYMVQQGPDLGHKMRDAFEQAFTLGYDRVILTGSDLPHLPGAVIVEAAQKTETFDVVIGPALDGGYYLVAMTRERFCPGMFDDIPWSTADVLNMTLERLAAGQCEFCLLKPLRDIDTLADLRAVSGETGLIFEVLNP
jgi:rSAM/selenodomain-associated transferase 1